MAGLGQQPGGVQQPAAQQQTPQGTTPPGMDDGEVMEEASPEEQQQYDTFVGMALLAVYDDQMMPETVKLIQEAPSPMQGVATVASSIAVRVYTAAQEDGVALTGDVLLHGGAEIVEAVIEVAETAGVAEFTEPMMQEAYLLAADKFRAEMETLGVYGEEDKAQDIATLQEMQQSGQMERIMSKLQQQSGGQPAPPAPQGLGPQEEQI